MNNSGKLNTGKVKKSRTGFTLVELLVVIAIIGILASMLMPAINSARESARAAQCGSNSRNLAMACNTYSSQNREMLPALDNNPGGSGLVELMPYLELGNLYDSLVSDVAPGETDADPSTYGTVSFKTPIFMCPSGTDQNTPGRSHFVMCVGTRMEYATQYDQQGSDAGQWTPEAGDGNGQGADGRGAFGTTALSMASMARDGASNTILYSEKSDKGTIQGSNAANMSTVGFDAGKKPNADMSDVLSDPTNQTHAHSNHPGGVSAAFGDAHVQFMSKDVEHNLWKALATANGGEAWGVAGSN